MAVPYTFGTATASIPLSQLDSNFATVITLGNTAIQLGNTVTTLNNMTLANVTISSGNLTLTNVSATTANVTTANVVTLIVTGNETVQGNTSVTGTATAAKFIPTGTSVTGNGMYLPATNSVGISTAGTNAVYIDASQNVGIGTSSPSAKLEVSSTAPTIKVTATSGQAIFYAQSSGTNASYLIFNSGGTETARLTAFSGGVLGFNYGASATEAMRISSTGAVSIVGTLTTGNPSPAVTVYTSSSGTYTTPTGAKYLTVRMVGGGGGGDGSGISATGGGTGGSTTFGTSLLTCTGAGGSAGGSASGGSFNLSGTAGFYGGVGNGNPGGSGGASPFAGNGSGVWANNGGQAATANTGSGGGGGGANSVNNYSALGGGSGGYLEKLISSPLATYAYAVGAGGTGGAAGTGGTAGGAGGSGVIIVTAYYD
jgi:hypothetical protein